MQWGDLDLAPVCEVHKDGSGVLVTGIRVSGVREVGRAVILHQIIPGILAISQVVIVLVVIPHTVMAVYHTPHGVKQGTVAVAVAAAIVIEVRVTAMTAAATAVQPVSITARSHGILLRRV